MFYYNYLVILGGRTEEDVKETPIQVYDTETSDWAQFSSFNKFRHATWINNNFLYSHGGFDHKSPLVSKNDLVEIDLIKLLSSDDKLKRKIDNIQEHQLKMQQQSMTQNNLSTKSNTPSLSPQNQSKDQMMYINKNTDIGSKSNNQRSRRPSCSRPS